MGAAWPRACGENSLCGHGHLLLRDGTNGWAEWVPAAPRLLLLRLSLDLIRLSGEDCSHSGLGDLGDLSSVTHVEVRDPTFCGAAVIPFTVSSR